MSDKRVAIIDTPRSLGKTIALALDSLTYGNTRNNPMLVSKAQFERFKKAGVPEDHMIIQQEMPRHEERNNDQS